MAEAQPDAGVRLQNLRDFTVQIRRPTDDATVGTGVAVSNDGRIVTCAHVVEAALNCHPRQADGKALGIYFPQARGGEEKARRATVAGCFHQHDDDVVLLQLVGGPPPLGPEQIAVLGRAEDSCYYPFRSYGYRRLENYVAGHAHGLILGCVPPPEGRDVQAEPVQLESQQVNQGMSGAAVLDAERNLVAGIVSETWFPDLSTKDRDTAWAVNARVLTFDPLNLLLHDAPLPRRPSPTPKTDVDAARRAAAPQGLAWNNAPAPIPEWVGRDDLLAAITRDWADPARSVSGLIGFGGEGKSSLARQWVENICRRGESATRPYSPDGVFWWGFYTRPSVDEFFEAALDYMGGGRIDSRRVPSAGAKAHLVAGMLYAGRYLFALDGLEVMQHQEGDQYGLLRSADLRQFLEYFAAPGHASFCLVTSRAPLLDLMAYTTYTHRDVTRLSPADGRALLRKVGVVGQDGILSTVVKTWDGHALTLSLLGGYLADRYGGDATHIDEIPPPTAGEPRYERVHRVLRRYDEHLTESERAFLALFSAFRTPVRADAFDKVFRAIGAQHAAPAEAVGAQRAVPLQELDDAEFAAMIDRLLAYRILRHDPRDETYTTHPLIRNHYYARLTAGERADAANAQAVDAHGRIKDYYLELAGDTPTYPSLDDLAPLIEVVHHACRAGAYDEAWDVLWGRIYQRQNRVIIHQLGAYETNLALMIEFFPDGNTSREPQISDPSAKCFILNAVGRCLMSLGRLGEAASFYERTIQALLDQEGWRNAGRGYQNLAELHAHLGALAQSSQAAAEALALARRAEDKGGECRSLAWQAWAAHLRGEIDAARAAFEQAEVLQREVDSSARYLYSLRGVQHADHLRRTGDADYAQGVVEANLEICQRNRWAYTPGMCHRVLGDLDADSGQHASARMHYDTALKRARSESVRGVLIEALLARGRHAARCARDPKGLQDPSGLVVQAFADLDEALGYAVAGGYRIYEADIRVALGWAHLAANSPSTGSGQAPDRARQEAQRAQQMSAQMGYHWGQVDAAELLAALD